MSPPPTQSPPQLFFTGLNGICQWRKPFWKVVKLDFSPEMSPVWKRWSFWMALLGHSLDFRVLEFVTSNITCPDWVIKSEAQKGQTNHLETKFLSNLAFYRWENWGPEGKKKCGLSEVTKLVGGRERSVLRHLPLQPQCLPGLWHVLLMVPKVVPGGIKWH